MNKYLQLFFVLTFFGVMSPVAEEGKKVEKKEPLGPPTVCSKIVISVAEEGRGVERNDPAGSPPPARYKIIVRTHKLKYYFKEKDSYSLKFLEGRNKYKSSLQVVLECL